MKLFTKTATITAQDLDQEKLGRLGRLWLGHWPQLPMYRVSTSGLWGTHAAEPPQIITMPTILVNRPMGDSTDVHDNVLIVLYMPLLWQFSSRLFTRRANP